MVFQRLSLQTYSLTLIVGVDGTVASESALRSAGILLWRVPALPPALRPDGGPQTLRSLCCGLAIYENKLTLISGVIGYIPTDEMKV
ncbi:hypothetical protein PoB_005885500 [Plakobranchus ocellatus]|uniref:Uncharacterized protein n=1 Tax=Plakobranchus ocellatus TaxID=259542 RepID=A0AAV4CHJ2_9GAST|nr:hypothetical protein PoB_005885500 [Plakobranchus ocellatus]